MVGLDPDLWRLGLDRGGEVYSPTYLGMGQLIREYGVSKPHAPFFFPLGQHLSARLRAY